MDEGEGDPLKRRGLPLPLHPSSWALSRIFSLGVFSESPYTIFCRPLGKIWKVKISWTKTRGGWSLPKAKRQSGEARPPGIAYSLNIGCPFLSIGRQKIV